VVDKPKLDQMLSNLSRYSGRLAELAGIGREAFLSNPDKIGHAKYLLVIAIECCIDVANHVISSENFRFPRHNADSFTVLVEQGILPEDKQESLRAMARFRNRLVHLYWEVDDDRVFEFLEHSLSDLEDFARAIANHSW
jgi:uncharacterized protein YutE (UPF0331/DUF86 family)